MSLSPVDFPSESPTLPTTSNSSTSGYRRGTRMSPSPPNLSTQLDSQFAAESSTKQGTSFRNDYGKRFPAETSFSSLTAFPVYKICGIKVAEYDEEEEVLKILGVVWSEKEEEEAFFRRTGIRKKDIDRSRTPSCVEWAWSFVNLTSLWLAFVSFHILASRLSIIYDAHFATILVCSTLPGFGLMVLMSYMQTRSLGMPFRLIGRFGRVVSDGVALVAAFISGKALPFDGSEPTIWALLLLVNLTLYLHSWLKIIHHADDIGPYDVMLEIIAQALIYISSGHDIMCFFIVFIFCGITCYKFVSYSVPITLEDRKKDLDSLPV